MFARRTTVLASDIGHWVPITAAAQVAEAVRSFSASA
jgi:hypothetical protein